MTLAAVLPVVLLALGALIVVMAGLTVTVRAVRRRRDAARSALTEPLRPVLLELVAGEPEEAQAAAQTLEALDVRRWRAIEPDLESLLLKVRGDSHRALVDVLERRGTLAHAVQRTRSRSTVTRARSANLLGAAGHAGAVDELIALLADQDPEVRQVAARALGRIRCPRAADPLLASVAGSHPVPAGVVARAVLNIGVTAHPALVRALDDADPLLRAVAAEVAGLDAALDAVPVLVRRLAHDDALEVRIRSARALGRIGVPAAVDPLLTATSASAPTSLRVVAARALGDVGSSAAVPRLQELLDDAAHRVASNAAAALARCGTDGMTALEDSAARRRGRHAREVLAVAELRGTRVIRTPVAVGGRAS